MSHPNIHPTGRLGHNPIVIDDDDNDNGSSSDETTTTDEMQLDYAGRQGQYLEQQGMGFRRQPPQSSNLGYTRPTIGATYTTTLEQEKKIRSRLREERHAALCVLMDRELLTVQALAAQETLPQTRRRFLAKLMSPEDPETAASIRSDHFTIQPHPSSSTTQSSTVQRRVVDVHETDDTGWRRPAPFSSTTSPRSSSMSSSAATTPAAATSTSTFGAGSGVGVGPGSGTRSGSGSGSRSPAMLSPAAATAAARNQRGRMSPLATTPERGRHGTGTSSGTGTGGRGRTSAAAASRSQQHRERERRRRWSGAEREDGMGGSFGGFLS